MSINQGIWDLNYWADWNTLNWTIKYENILQIQKYKNSSGLSVVGFGIDGNAASTANVKVGLWWTINGKCRLIKSKLIKHVPAFRFPLAHLPDFPFPLSCTPTPYLTGLRPPSFAIGYWTWNCKRNQHSCPRESLMCICFCFQHGGNKKKAGNQE